MDIHIESDAAQLGRKAAEITIENLQNTLKDRGEANLILATGASQLTMIQELIRTDLDWSRITCFHLDEYVGMPITHSASFRKYLKERFADQVKDLKEFHWVNADAADPAAECRRLGEIISRHPIDVACVGIGENGHLAFNDPPADFETTDPYLVVDLDEDCRRQQMGEGWFPTLDDVPTQAISMSIRQIMKSAVIVCTVPDERKANAVKATLEGQIYPDVPASIMREHPNAALILDKASASLLDKS